MPTTEQIQTRLAAIACPICRKQDFSIRVKSENPDGENVYNAMCNGCRYTFPVSTENRLYRLSNPEIESWLNGIPCRKCGKRGAEMDFRCMVTVRDSRLFFHCKNCGFETYESMPAEAFE